MSLTREEFVSGLREVLRPLIDDVAWIKRQLQPVQGYGDDPTKYELPMTLKGIADRVYVIEQALQPIKGYGDDPEEYPVPAVLKGIADRVYVISQRP